MPFNDATVRGDVASLIPSEFSTELIKTVAEQSVVLGMASNGSAQNNGANGTIMWRPG